MIFSLARFADNYSGLNFRDGFAGFIEALENIRSIVVSDHLALFMDVASVLAACLAAWSYIRISHDYIEGQGITFWMLIKPLVLTIIVCNFDFCVLKPTHALTNVFCEMISFRTEDSFNSFFDSTGDSFSSVFSTSVSKAIADYNEMVGEDAEGSVLGIGSKEEDGGWLKRKLEGPRKFFAGIACGIIGFTSTVGNLVQLGSFMPFMGLVYFLLTVIYYVQVLLCYVYLMFYALLGPFTFAISILGSYSRGITEWFSRYIQTALWVPVGQIVMMISAAVLGNIGEFIGSTGGMAIGMAVMIAAILALKSVPKLCSYIIESTGTAGAAEGSMNMAGKGAAVVRKVATKGLA